MNNNELSGSIPSQLGAITALTALCAHRTAAHLGGSAIRLPALYLTECVDPWLTPHACPQGVRAFERLTRAVQLACALRAYGRYLSNNQLINIVPSELLALLAVSFPYVARSRPTRCPRPSRRPRPAERFNLRSPVRPRPAPSPQALPLLHLSELDSDRDRQRRVARNTVRCAARIIVRPLAAGASRVSTAARASATRTLPCCTQTAQTRTSSPRACAGGAA